MMAKGKDGIPLRHHYQKAAEGLFPSAAAIAKLASEPRLPASSGDVWAHFLELHARRPVVAEIGPIRLPWSEIEAYRNASGAKLSGWHRSTISALEDAYFAVRAEHEK